MSKKDTPYTEMKKPVSLLFGGQPSGIDNSIAETDLQTSNQIALAIAQIKLPSSQPRRYFDEHKLEELSRSIKQFGILEPLLVRPITNGDYELVAGERRLRAAQLAGLTEVPVVIREMDDTTTAQVRLIENLQREDLNPLEETEGILELLSIQLMKSPLEVISLLHHMQNSARGKVTQNVFSNNETLIAQDVFDALGKISWESFVTSRLPLLKLPSDVLLILRQGKIEYTKARAIATVKDTQQRASILDAAITGDLSLTKIKELIKQLPSSKQETSSEIFKTRYSQIGKRLSQSKVWEDTKKSKRLSKLLSELENLLDEPIVNDQ